MTEYWLCSTTGYGSLLRWLETLLYVQKVAFQTSSKTKASQNSIRIEINEMAKGMPGKMST